MEIREFNKRALITVTTLLFLFRPFVNQIIWIKRPDIYIGSLFYYLGMIFFSEILIILIFKSFYEDRKRPFFKPIISGIITTLLLIFLLISICNVWPKSDFNYHEDIPVR